MCKGMIGRACLILMPLGSALFFTGCGGGSDSSTSSTTTTSSSTSSSSSSSTTSTTSSSSDDSTSTASCDSTYAANVVSAAEAFDSTLTATQLAKTLFSSSTSTSTLNTYKTEWSNLPGPTRPGVTLGELTTSAQVTAFNTLAQVALSGYSTTTGGSTGGYLDLEGVLAADDYLGYTSDSAHTASSSGYGADKYHIAFIGTPSATGLWTLMIGGHHLAYNLTFYGGCLYPTPHHMGVEPKATFAANNHYATSSSYAGKAVYDSGTYTVLNDKASAMFALIDSFSSTQLASAFLSGQQFSDIVIGPVEYGTGSYSAVTSEFSAIASQSSQGVLVSALTTAQQALVTAAIKEYVSDYDDATATRLLEEYEASYSSTYVAWGNKRGSYSGTATAPSVDTDGTYLRINGPRVWIEVACQAAVVLTDGSTHYHMMFRDKSYDYYNKLSSS